MPDQQEDVIFTPLDPPDVTRFYDSNDFEGERVACNDCGSYFKPGQTMNGERTRIQSDDPGIEWYCHSCWYTDDTE